MKWNRIRTDLRIFFGGHVFNSLFSGRAARRRRREATVARAVDSYLDCLVPVLRNVPEDADTSVSDGECRPEEKIFSIWLQGEDAAPEIVKACWRSIRHNCTQELVVLDDVSLWKWIELPDHIMHLWKSGRMKPAHFSDICRIELLYRYGGIWFDATDFVTSPVPAWVIDEDFFIYIGGKAVKGALSFVQNCFFRAKKGNYILKVWREAVFAYWKMDERAVTYFIHQLLLKKAVDCNPLAGEYFSRMPHVPQDCTHMLWWAYRDRPFDRKVFSDITSGAVFQKTEYKSASARHPLPGSFAQVMIDMYR